MIPSELGMTEARHPYAGRRAILATMHRKEEVIAPALLSGVGLLVAQTPGLDTDQLGTFSGEMPRQGTMFEVAVRKARLGMNVTGLPLGIASEGTFGPHPAIPFMPAGMELMVFIDDDRKVVVSESLIVEATNFEHLVVASGDAFEAFLERIGFPAHGVIVRPNKGRSIEALTKGIAALATLDRAIIQAASHSPDGKARIETDMRAHFNPTRMKSLAALAERLGRRLATLCPACDAPGFGRTGSRLGLPCEDCCTPTQMIAAEVFSCQSCNQREERLRSDTLLKAPARYCPECNP
jgi:hypothetical protein